MTRGRGIRAALVYCRECDQYHDRACPSPEEIWGRIDSAGQIVGGMVNEPRAVAVRREAERSAMPVPAVDERTVRLLVDGLPAPPRRW